MHKTDEMLYKCGFIVRQKIQQREQELEKWFPWWRISLKKKNLSFISLISLLCNKKTKNRGRHRDDLDSGQHWICNRSHPTWAGILHCLHATCVSHVLYSFRCSAVHHGWAVCMCAPQSAWSYACCLVAVNGNSRHSHCSLNHSNCFSTRRMLEIRKVVILSLA